MNSQRTAAMQQFLQKLGCLEESSFAQESSEDMQMRIGTLSMHLNTGFTTEQLVLLKKFGSSGRCNPDENTQTTIASLKQLRTRFFNQAKAFIVEVQCQLIKSNEIARDVLGTSRGEHNDDVDENDDDELSGNKAPISNKRFFNPLKSDTSIEDSATRIGNWLAFIVHLKQSGDQVIDRCGLKLTLHMKQLIDQFEAKPIAIPSIVVQLLERQNSIRSSYEAEPLVWFGLVNFFDATGEWILSENAQKTLSAIKYACRGSILLHFFTDESLDASLMLRRARSLLQLNSTKATSLARWIDCIGEFAHFSDH